MIFFQQRKFPVGNECVYAFLKTIMPVNLWDLQKLKNRENVLIESKENIKAWRRYNWNLLVLFMM